MKEDKNNMDRITEQPSDCKVGLLTDFKVRVPTHGIGRLVNGFLN
jgi:hypothetical protein